MAFMNRGESVTQNNSGADNNNSNSNSNSNDYSDNYYGYYGPYYRIDGNFVLIETIMTGVLILIAIICYIVTYKTAIIDPLEKIKQTYFNTYNATLIFLVISGILTTYFSKDKKSMIKKLCVVLFALVVIISAFYITRVKLDNKYTKDKFEELYLEVEDDEKMMDILDSNLISSGIASYEKYYVSECVKLYNIFKIKSNVLIFTNLVLIVLLGFFIFKLIDKKIKLNKLDKDDKVLFDEEENIKF